MKSLKRLLGLLYLLIFASFGIAVATADATPVRIMPLGDSITLGCCSGSPAQGGYRNRLHSLLTTAGYNVDFVGTNTDSGNPSLPDTNHQGQGGYQIDEIRDGINGWLKEIEDPDVILLHIGTNNFTAGHGIPETQDSLKSLIAELSVARPFAKIVVTSLLPRTDNSGLEAMQEVFNQSLPGIVGEQASLGRQVSFLDLHDALNAADLNDGVHPKPAGYEKIADAWVPAITAVITPDGTSNPPAIARLDARADLTHLTVRFSKPVEDAATALSNYSLDGGVSILNAELDPVSKRVVTLTTSAQTPGTLYTLAVTGVRDRTPQMNLIPADSTRSFTSRTLIDGSFESNAQGWSLSGSNQVTGSPLTATDGTKLMVFNGAGTPNNGVASQVIATTPGKKYKLNFDMGVNGSSAPQALSIDVTGNFPLLAETEQLAGPGSGATEWENKTYEFVANSTTTTVTFGDDSTTSTDVDLLLDDVRLNLVITPTLTVVSSPATGVSVTVSPNDINTNGNGVTGFTRTYNEGATVNLTAPATNGGLNFEKWQRDGVDYSNSPAISVTMDANHTMKAIYSLLNNGSFELGTPDGGGVIASVPSWTTSGEVFGYVSNGPYQANHGSRLLVFNGGNPSPTGVVSQSFPTVSGQTYFLEFDMGVLGTIAQQVQVSLTGTGSLLSANSTVTGNSASIPKWEAKSHSFTANSSTTTLTFTDTSSTTSLVDLLLDNVRVHLTETNTAPVAANDAYPATQSSPLVVPASGVLANDTDAQFNPLTAVLNVGPTHGSVTLDSNGGFTYTPTNGYTGSDSFTYHANDGSLDSNIATVTLTVDPPPSQLLTNGSFELGTADGNGVVANVTGWTGTGNRFGYVASSPYTSTDGARLMVFNGGPSTPNGTLSQTFATTPGQAYLLEFDMGAVGPIGQAQQFSVTLAGTGTLFSATDSAIGNGPLVSAWQAKSHVFVANSNSTTLTFTDTSSTSTNVDLLLDHARVTTSTARSLAVTSSPASGAAVTVSPADLNANGDGTAPFTRYFTNGASINLTASATNGGAAFVKWQKNGVDFSSNAAISVTMDANHTLNAVYLAGNQPPVAVADSYTLVQDTQLVVPVSGVLANDTDPESNPLTALPNAGPAHGSLTLNTNGSFTYTPTAAYTGTDSFTYHANDGTSDSNVVTVSLTINPTGTEILVNGSFESGEAGWTMTGSRLAYQSDGTYVATHPEPTASARMMILNAGNVTPNAVISQSFATTPGQTYLLSFDMGVVGGVGQPQALGVSVMGSSSLVSLTDTATGNGATVSAWAPKSHSFVANSATTVLTFTDVSATGNFIDLLLDHVQVTAGANRTLSIASAPVTGIAITVSPGDLVLNTNGVTNFTRTYADGVTVNLTAPLESGVADFQKWQKNGVDFTTNASTSVLMDADITMTAVYIVNAAPVAVNDSYSATKNTALVVAAPGVLTNDTDPESSALTAILNAGPSHGTLTLNSNGSFTYTPDSEYLGSDSFTYHANDGELNSSIATVNLSVNAPNSLVNGSFELGTTGWTVSGNQVVVTANSSYLATDGVKLMVFNGGPATPNAVISQSFPTTPGQPYKLEFDMGVLAFNNQQQQLNVTVAGAATLLSQTESATGNGQGNSVYATKTYTFVADSSTTTLSLSDLSTATTQIDLLLDNVRVTAGAVRTLTVTSPVPGGVTVTVSPADLAAAGNGTTGFTRSYVAGTTVNLTAQAVAAGGNFLKWQKNGSDYAATAATSLLVDQNTTMAALYSPNAAPVAVADSYSVAEDAVLTVPAAGVLANDSDPEAGPFTAVLNANTTHGSLALAADGGFTYTPDANYQGPDSFTYHANDGSLSSGVVAVSLTVTSVNDTPVADAKTLTLDEDVPTAVTLTGSDALDNDPLTFVVTVQPQHGTLGGTSPNLTYTPAANYNGSDSFSYVANDGTVNSAPAVVSITIAPVADVPVALAQSVTVTGGTSISITLAGSDPDGQAVTFSTVAAPAHGVLSGTPPNVLYTPAQNYQGSDSFTFITNDGTSDSLPATVSITVNPVLVNGSFENGITGWTATGNYQVANSVTTPPNQRFATDGTKLVALNAGQTTPNAVISQSFATTPGQPYILEFDMGFQAFNNSTVRMETTVTGSSALVSDITTLTAANQGISVWTAKSFPFLANSATTTLTFRDTTPNAGNLLDLLLDHVRITPQITRLLTVASSPNTPVAVTVSPSDILGGGNGTTGFTRNYMNGAVVNLTVPAVIGATNFQKWQRDGVDLTTNTATSVTMGGPHTMTAFYIPNAPPVVVADSYSTDEDVQLVVPVAGVLANDSDPELKPITALLDVGPAHGVLVLNANGSFTYTPAANYHGPDSFTYHAYDGVVNSSISTVNLTVNSVNDLPVAVADSGSVAEDGILTVAAAGVLTNDTDVESDPLTAVLNVGPVHGVLALATDGGFTYTPAADYSGPDSFTYHANDGLSNSNVVTVSITVTPVNDVPLAAAQSVSTDEDVAKPITLTGSDADANPLTFTVLTQPQHGALAGTVPNLTYTPAANYSGSDSFTFKVNDGTVDSLTATVSITVASVNDSPLASAQSVNVDEDGSVPVTLAGSDVEETPLTFTVVTQPSHGLLTGTVPNLTYTPAANYNGTDSFTFKANDGAADSLVATVSIAVAPVNDTPVASAQSVSVDEDVAKPITLTGSDVDATPLTFVVVDPPQHGILTGTVPNLTYTPAANYNGPDSFTFKANDGTVDSVIATVTIVVAAINDAPQASPQLVNVNEDSSVPVTLIGSDIEGSPLTFTVVAQPQHGTLIGTVPDLTYIPAANYHGADSFTYKANDGLLDSMPATVSIAVASINDVPLASAQSVNVDEDVAKPITLTGSDVDGNPLTFTVVAQPANGLLTGTAPNLTYTPAANYNGPDSFTFKANDGLVDSVTATVTITVAAINDAPLAAAQSVTTDEDISKAILLGGSDVEGDSLTFTVVTPPLHGTFTGTAPNLTYVPTANYNGPDSFTFKTNDGTVDSADATVSITVAAINDAPLAAAQSVTTDEDVSKAITLGGSDVDGNPLTFAVVTQPLHGTFTGTAPNLTYVPTANYNGPDSFTFKSNDGTIDSADATVSITVAAINDAPLAAAQWVTTDEDISKAILLGGSDVDGDTLTFAVVTQPLHGTFTGTAPNLTYVPTANYNGPDSFTFKSNDGTTDSAEATVSITVASINDTPLAAAQSVTTDEDVSKTITLGGSDLDGDTLTFSVVTQPLHGTFTGTAPNLTYVPTANYNGPDSFTFKSNDGTTDSAEATVSITVASINDTPLAAAQSVTTDEDVSKAILLGGSDVDGDSLVFTVVTQPSHGLLTGTVPNLTYVPASNYNGPDSFTFKANDGTVDSTLATVSITVSSINDAPLAVAQSVTTDEDTAKSIVLTGSDAEGQSLIFAVVAQPLHGVLSGTMPNLTYTPEANYNGPDSFTFKTNDGTVDSVVATVSITVAGINDTPLASAQSVTTVEDVVKAITLGGSDVEGSSLTFAVVIQPLHGALTGTVPNLTYTPVANYNGPDSFTFKVNDGALDSATATVSITVTSVNDSPLASAQSVTTDEDVSKAITLAGTDVEGDSLTFAVVAQPQHGALGGTAPNLTYTPAANYNGPDSFTFKSNDGTVDSPTVTVSITVTAVNDVPLAAAQSVATDEDVAKTVTLAGSDVEGSPLTFAIVAQPQHGALTGTAPNLTYTPEANYHGPDSFTFKVNDGTSDSSTATVSITVASINDAPLASAQSVSTNEDTAKAITLAGTDIEGDSLAFAVVTQPQHGSLTGTAPNLTYTPAANYSGTDSFTFKTNDGAVDSAPATVSITVNPVIDDGFANWLAGFGIIGNPNDDPDHDSLTNAVEFVVGGNPANHSDVNLLPSVSLVTADPDLNTVNADYLLFTYRRTDLAKGDDRTTINVQWSTNLTAWTNANGTPGVVTVEADDAAAAGIDLVRVYLPRSLAVAGKLFARLQVFIDVPPANVAPVAQPQTLNVNENVNLPITLTATDANGDPLTYQIVAAPQHGTFTGTAPNLTYVPTPNYSGADSFTFKANDGKVDSPAATVSITVNPVNRFNQWLSGYSLTSTPGADSDGDSISNAVEYVIGGNPAGNPDTAMLPTVSLVNADPDNNLTNENYVVFTYRRTDLANTDPKASITVEWDTDLVGPWTNATGTAGVVVIADDNAVASNIDLVKVYIPRSLSVNGRLFARLNVSVTVP